MDDSNKVIVCPQCKSKEVIAGKLYKDQKKYACLTCGFRGPAFYSISKEEAKKLPDKPRNFDESIFGMEDVVRKDHKASFSMIRVAEMLMLGLFMAFVLFVLLLVFIYPNL